MITLLQYFITGLYHEIRNIPKHYKRFNHDEKRVFKNLLFYYAYLFLIIPCLFKLPESWFFVILCLAIIVWQIRSLTKEKILLTDMSKRFKYHAQQRFISLHKKYYGLI